MYKCSYYVCTGNVYRSVHQFPYIVITNVLIFIGADPIS